MAEGYPQIEYQIVNAGKPGEYEREWVEGYLLEAELEDRKFEFGVKPIEIKDPRTEGFLVNITELSTGYLVYQDRYSEKDKEKLFREVREDLILHIVGQVEPGGFTRKVNNSHEANADRGTVPADYKFIVPLEEDKG